MRERQWGRSGAGGRRRTDRLYSLAALSGAEDLEVLVADDNPGSCLMQAIYLRALGCKVFTAHDGLDALDHATVLSPDVIVMNLEIPRIDGCEAIRRLNALNARRRIPVVAVTADPDSRWKAFEAGCAAFLMKPYTPQVLWAQICALLRFPERRREPSVQG